MKKYAVRKIVRREFTVDVPASKSILNRALVLAAFSGNRVVLKTGAYAQDTRNLIACLTRLGVNILPTENGLAVCGEKLLEKATLDVGSAGTAARFLTAVLAFRGGDYEFTASPQMTARPMENLLAFEQAGVGIEYRGEYGHFPFRMHGDGIKATRMETDTGTSTQYASGMLLAAALGDRPFTLKLTGERTQGSYIRMTLSVLKAFGAKYTQNGEEITVFPARHVAESYTVEADVSAACYFYALSLLCGARVTVRGIRRGSLQGDMRFLELHAQKGVVLSDGAEGLTADGSTAGSFGGFDIDMRDFSDQAATLAVLAPFATTPSNIRGIGHIRRQECDRIQAITRNLTACDVPCTAYEDGIRIMPAEVKSAEIETFGDHRIAMAFALIGAKTGGIVIDDADCCKKTFENFFETLAALSE